MGLESIYPVSFTQRLVNGHSKIAVQDHLHAFVFTLVQLQPDVQRWRWIQMYVYMCSRKVFRHDERPQGKYSISVSPALHLGFCAKAGLDEM